MNEDKGAEESSYPLFFVIGLAVGLPVGQSLGGGSFAVIGLVIGGGLGKAIDDLMKKRR